MRHTQISLCGLDENKEDFEKLFAIRVGQEISNCRKAKGHTQKEFAELLNQSIQQVQNYEYGKGNITLYKLVEIAEVLDTSIINFIIDVSKKYDGKAFAGKTSKQYNPQDSAQAAISAKINTLTEEQQKALATLLLW